MREEMGPEFDEVDWKKLDPRQYDPRRIIREALLDDPVGAVGPAAATAAATGQKAASAGSSVGRSMESAYEKRQRRLGKGRPAPFDAEAT
jgi:sec-independent protein translocase protein TatB